MMRFRLNNNITLRSWIFYTLQKIHLLSGLESHEVLFKKWAGVYLNCEQQSLFFFRFSKGSALVCEHWAAKPQDMINEGHSPRRPLVMHVVICVSRTFCSTDQEKRETARSLKSVIRFKNSRQRSRSTHSCTNI